MKCWTCIRYYLQKIINPVNSGFFKRSFPLKTLSVYKFQQIINAVTFSWVCLFVCIYFITQIPIHLHGCRYTCVWKRCYEVINSADRFQARVQVCFIPCFSKTRCTAACMSVHFINIQTDMCICQCVYISLLLLGFTHRQPACFGSTPQSHMSMLWSIRPAGTTLEVNGGKRLKMETTNTH